MPLGENGKRMFVHERILVDGNGEKSPLGFSAVRVLAQSESNGPDYGSKVNLISSR